jgi:hypothetical protein
MPGPLAEVATTVARVNLDVSRTLNLGEEAQLRFVRPDADEATGWAEVLVVTDGWDRVSGDEELRGDGQTVMFDVVEREAAPFMGEVLRINDLHVECEGVRYKVGNTPRPPSNQAQVYHLTCSTRTLRRGGGFDNTK